MKTADRFSELQAFIAAAQRLSFVAAADSLDVPPSIFSRRIAALEARLGVRLFHRTTRQVALTEAGHIYYRSCAHLLGDLEEADAAVSTLHASPQGTLRVHLPVTFGKLHVSPHLPELMDRFPEMSIDLTMSDHMVDLIEHRVDVAIRIGELSDSSIVARVLAPNRRVLCASPAYLERYGIPRTPADLRGHNCLNFSHLVEGDVWRFIGPDGEQAVTISGRLRANNTEVLRDAALGHCGIALLATFIVGSHLRNGDLQLVLGDFPLPPTNIHAIYPNREFVSAKVKAFVDFFAAKFAKPYWE